MAQQKYCLERREYNLLETRDEGRPFQTFHSSQDEIMEQIRQDGRLDWWFEHQDYDEEDEEAKKISEEYGIDADDLYQIFDKPFPVFWRFYQEVIGTHPCSYEIKTEN